MRLTTTLGYRFWRSTFNPILLKMSMNAYELKKIQVEYKRVNAAREEQELRILEFQEQIKRLEASIEVSIAKENELLQKLKESQ